MKIAVILSFVLCAAQAAPSNTEDPLQLVSVGNSKFAAATYKEIQKTNKGNLIFSPFSAETVLALLSDGAKGETRTELLTALHLPESHEKIQQGFKEILPLLKLNSDVDKLLAANRIYVNESVKLEDDFKKIAEQIYESGVENVNFANSKESTDIINRWVEDQTNNKINHLVEEDSVDDSTAIVLVNALYLSARWSSPFKSQFTKPGKFHKSATEVIDIPFMSQKDSFQYYDNKELNAQFLQLTYKDRHLSMVFILPHESEGLAALENNIEQVFEPQPTKYQYVDVKLPPFTIDSEIKFVDILKSLGVKKIFDNADLSGLSSTHKNLFVTNVIQKAFINVTESGTEAAAATAALVGLRSQREFIGEPTLFHADHPFIYLIKYDDVILFAGKYNP